MDNGREQRNTREFFKHGKQQGAGVAITTSIPPESYAQMKAQVMALKPHKRKHWTLTLTDRCGQRTRVRYVEAGIEMTHRDFVSHVENKLSGEKASTI